LRLELLSEADPRANLKYPIAVEEQKKAAKKKLESDEKDTSKKPTADKFWAKGTGYGHQGQTTWDVQAYLAAQREKDLQTERVLRGTFPSMEFLAGC
jgi:baculoviral IAP repeat-containing protein 6